MILAVKEDVGRRIGNCSQNTWHDDGIILSKAGRIALRFLFTKEEIFEGDLSKNDKRSLFQFLC